MPRSDLILPRRLAGRLALLAFCLLLANALALWFYTDTSSFSASFRAIHRKTDLIDSIPSPRLIVVGGSSVLYGQDSRAFEREVGMPVINMGTHGGLGLRYMLSNVRAHIGRGDVVIVASEYSHFIDTFEGFHPLLHLLLLNPDAISNITSSGQERVLALAVPTLCRMSADTLVARAYAATAGRVFGFPQPVTVFKDTARNEEGYHGDTWNRERMRRGHPLRDWLPMRSDFDARSFVALEEFRRECERRGARMLVEYPPVPEGFYILNEKPLLALHARLCAAFPGLVLRTPRDSAYPEWMFLDTIYHLNTVGRAERTRQLAAAVAARLRADAR
jgi:hypothetical protein